ncbi:hypothetical protein MLD38_023067 [Melastoma candidum]|uniref:Uncharacterized protein n=1 Tax=Melastoma candidum TaxID=119954 RepID=A0ACB9QLA6_9MYRT|nr:hypothetical protein MLD38_023067 [Melastoma candidum]
MTTAAAAPAKKSWLEMRILYCKDLRAFNFFQKLSVYASVSLSSDHPSLKLPPHDPNRLRTPADKDGDGNPEWNHTLSLDLTPVLSSLPPHNRDSYDRVFVLFHLFHEGGMFGDKRIGEVRVALSEFFDRDIRQRRGSVRIVSYQVKSPDGKPNGVLTFSYKLQGEEEDYIPIGGGFPSIDGFPIVHPLPETSGPSSSSSSEEITYPKIDLDDYAFQETSYYPPPGTHYHPPPAAPPPVAYPMPPPPPLPMPLPHPMYAAPGGCYYPAVPPMPAHGPWQHHGHHGHVQHCSTRGGGGWWRM